MGRSERGRGGEGIIQYTIAGICELELKVVPDIDIKLSLNGNWGSLCLDCTNNMAYSECLLSFWKSRIWVHDRQRTPM